MMTQPLSYTVLTLNSQTLHEPISTETDEEIIERLRTRFNMLKELTSAVKKGHIRGMIVSGPPGVGKSSGIEEVVQKHNMFDTVGERFQSCKIIRGTISPVILYQKLYEYKDKNNLIVFDDTDSVLKDEEGINIIKAALDSGERRTLSYHKDSRILRDAGIPNEFDFEGGAIFLTNLKLSNIRGKNVRDHIAALESRCHYLDLTIDTAREKILRIKQVIADGMLGHLTQDDRDDIVEFIESNASKMREISLRSAIKAAELKQAMPSAWRMFAQETLLR
jgi:DNA-binding NarL/FixJ family response regulator